MGVNKAILLGNVGKDPQIRHLDNGTAVCNFTMATNRFYTDSKGERQQVTEWHNIVMWRKLAEIANEYVRKGTQIYVEGRLQTRQYTDKEGQTKYITEVVGNSMELLSRGSGSGAPGKDGAYDSNNLQQSGQSSGQSGGASETTASGAEEDEGDDLPF